MTKSSEQNIRHQYTKHRDDGFSLLELIVVIAIMAVLVGILAPLFFSYMHKSRVAADWANLKAYYNEIEVDYISTGEYNPKVPTTNWENPGDFQKTEITFLDGRKAEMKDGYYAITKSASEHGGYQISYYCNKCLTDWDKHSKTCMLVLGT